MSPYCNLIQFNLNVKYHFNHSNLIYQNINTMVIEISSDSSSDDGSNSDTSDSDLEQSITDKKQIRYYKPDQTQMVYDGYIYNFVLKNKNKTSRWRCSTCCGCALVNN